MEPIVPGRLAEGEDFAIPSRYLLQVADPTFEQPMELDERVLTALRAENGPFIEGRELAITARACLAELRRARTAQIVPAADQIAS
jgi:hypothetical protein